MSDEFAWLIEVDGPHYLYLDKVGLANVFAWTRDANKAIRFGRDVDAEAIIDGLRKIEPRLFDFPTGAMPRAVEHGWMSLREVSRLESLKSPPPPEQEGEK